MSVVMMVVTTSNGDHHKPSLPTAFYQPKGEDYKPAPAAHHHGTPHQEHQANPPSYAYEHPTEPPYEYDHPAAPSYPYQYPAEEPYYGSAYEYNPAPKTCSVHHVTVWERECKTHYRYEILKASDEICFKTLKTIQTSLQIL